MQLTQDNYPESLYQSYIINAPTIFTIIWSVIKIFLDAKTRNKVHIMGHGKHVFEHLAKKTRAELFSHRGDGPIEIQRHRHCRTEVRI